MHDIDTFPASSDKSLMFHGYKIAVAMSLPGSGNQV